MLKKYSWAGSLPVISLTLRPNFAVKILELLPGLLRQRETFPPCLELNQFTVIVLRTATNSYQAIVAVAWRRVTPLNTLITYMSAHKLREALDGYESFSFIISDNELISQRVMHRLSH